MDAQRPDDTRSQEAEFAAAWSSDGVTRSFAPTATGIPADLPVLFSGGQHFGPYVIVRAIAKGGMGQVCEAEEIESGRRVAVKILSRGIGDDEERERFLREGRLAASLSHPNTVYVFGTTEVQGFPVIAMELAPSGTLKELVTPGKPMAIFAAVHAVLQVIDGLDAAASLGIIHRDVKPSNWRSPTFLAMLAQTAVLALFAAGVMWALRNPARGLQDRVAGTWIVPR